MSSAVRRAAVVAITILGLVTASAVANPAEPPEGKPDATVKLTGGTAAIGIGYTWGSGVLTYQGKQYKFKINGLSTTAVGASSIDAVGDVYHLAKLEDFNGHYAGVTTAAAVGGGVSFTAIKNGSGVYIQLHGTSVGLLFKAGPSGINVELEK